MNKLSLNFYRRENIFQISLELIGKILVSHINGIRTSGRIVEIEAYNGIIDKASHAYNGKRTKRNETMYAEAGKAYMYICYGMHDMFNVITNEEGIPHAILIRAIEPLEGMETMMKRKGLSAFTNKLTICPGNLSKAMGLNVEQDGEFLNSKTVYIAEDGFHFDESLICRSARIGMTSAGEDSLQPYRFYVKGNPFVSSAPR